MRLHKVCIFFFGEDFRSFLFFFFFFFFFRGKVYVFQCFLRVFCTISDG